MRLSFSIVTVLFLLSCGRSNTVTSLESELIDFASQYPDARIGVAVVTDEDTVGIAINDTFPMMSVYKFPIALDLARKMLSEGKSPEEKIAVPLHLLPTDTYSPMLTDYAGQDTVNLSIRELMRYSLQASDNNASDILLKECGGASEVDDFMKALNIGLIKVRWSEEEMYVDPYRSYDNACTPEAMASLFYRFCTGQTDYISDTIKTIMESCTTGTDRIPAPLVERGCRVGHKTGTGFTLPSGRLMALNDAAYVILPDGRTYALAVFIEDSGYTPEETAGILADISRIVYKFMMS